MSEINSTRLQRELDKLIGESSSIRIVVSGRGFTTYDMMERVNITRWKALKIIQEGLRNGRVKHIGYRSGQAGMKVYDTIREE